MSGNNSEKASGAGEKESKKLSKEEKRALEKQRLEDALAAHRVDSVRERVAYILNNYPAARNSDKTLSLVYWELFQKEKFDADLVEKIFKLEHVPTLARERAKIQNSFGLFQANEEVRKRRGAKEVENQEVYAPANEIGFKITVCADETGKSDLKMAVGGVWFLDPEKYFDVWIALKTYRENKGLKSEIKFSSLSKRNFDDYWNYVTEFLRFQAFTSFKIVYLSMKDLRRPTEEAVYDLYRHFLLEGAKFEVSRGRVSLPRQIELMKDKDEGSDVIGLKDMTLKLRAGLNTTFDGGLVLEDVYAVPSCSNHIMQAVDLILGSFGRAINRLPGSDTNHKDDFSAQMLATIGVSPESFSVNHGSDWLQITKLQ